MSTNPFRDSTSGDYLDKVKRHMLENRAGNTSSHTLTPQYIIPIAESAVTVTDAAVVNPNKQTITESITVTDAATATGYTDPFEWYISEASIPATPIKWEFFDWRIP